MNSNPELTLSASTVIRETKALMLGLVFGYLSIFGLSLYLSLELPTFKDPYFLPLGFALLGAALTGSFLPLSAGRDPEGGSIFKDKLLFIIFQLAQGGVGFALARFFFNLSVKGALAFPLGALVATSLFFLLSRDKRSGASSMVAAALGGVGLTLALRLQGVVGSLFFALALTQGAWIGFRLLAKRDAQLVWIQSLFFLALLVIGRSAIQYYLLQSNYAHLGVVISQPYTFVALGIGVLLPFAYEKIDNENLLPWFIVFILAGLLLPLALGVFLHVRPMAAYLMGLVLSTFALGALSRGSLKSGILALTNFAVVCLALPLFQKANGWDRALRLEILAGLALIVFLTLALSSRWTKPDPES